MTARQPHTHMTCGFCLQPKIIRSKPHETKSGQPICPDCLEEYNRCFPPLTSVNNLPKMQAEFAF
jgi:transposase-like protein